MAKIRNLDLLKKFVDFFQFKTGDFIGTEVGDKIVPVVAIKIPSTFLRLTPTEAQMRAGVQVPSGKKWKIISIRILWVSDVNAGNREIILEIYSPDFNTAMMAIASRNFQPASVSVSYSFFAGAGDPVGSSSGDIQTLPLPEKLWLQENSHILLYDFVEFAAGDTVPEVEWVIEERDAGSDEFEERAVP